jgi:hypothetical protein
MIIKHFAITRLMISWNEQQVLSDIKNYPDMSRAQERLNSRVRNVNSFYIPSMNSQTNDQFENIFLIDRIHKDLDYSAFNFHKLKNCKILCQESHRSHDENLSQFYSENQLEEQEKDQAFKTIQLADGTKKKIEILSALSVNDNYKTGCHNELQNYVSKKYSDLDLIITTRMDTDDAIQKNYVQNIQNIAYDRKSRMFIDHRSVLSAQIRNYCPPQIKTFKEFRYGGSSGTMMLSTAFKPSQFQTYNCYSAGHHDICSRFRVQERHRIEDMAGLYLHWRGNMTKNRLGTHTFRENTPQVKDYFPFLHDYDNKSNCHNFR